MSITNVPQLVVRPNHKAQTTNINTIRDTQPPHPQLLLLLFSDIYNLVIYISGQQISEDTHACYPD